MALVAQLVGPTLNRCADCCSLLLSPSLLQLWHDKASAYGPIVAGGLFGAGWWFWVDAVVKQASVGVGVPFVQYLPGIIATVALIMISCVRSDDMDQYDPFDEGVYCRSRFWLFISYVVSFGAVVGAVWVFLAGYATVEGVNSVWPGVAAVFQVCLVLGAGLVMFISRGPVADNSGLDPVYEPF